MQASRVRRRQLTHGPHLATDVGDQPQGDEAFWLTGLSGFVHKDVGEMSNSRGEMTQVEALSDSHSPAEPIGSALGLSRAAVYRCSTTRLPVSFEEPTGVHV